jgi:GH18 family chitinase
MERIGPSVERGAGDYFQLVYDEDRQELISYDDFQVLIRKCYYLFSQAVGGFMF